MEVRDAPALEIRQPALGIARSTTISQIQRAPPSPSSMSEEAHSTRQRSLYAGCRTWMTACSLAGSRCFSMMAFSARSRSRYCSVRIVAVNSPGRKASLVLSATRYKMRETRTVRNKQPESGNGIIFFDITQPVARMKRPTNTFRPMFRVFEGETIQAYPQAENRGCWCCALREDDAL